MNPMNKTLIATALATATTAAVGALATRSGSRWYRRLSKPSWQPPAQVFPLVWNPLYALIAYGGARALTSADGAERDALTRTLAANLALNAAWPALFFRARSPRLALTEIIVLNASNLMLVRQARGAVGAGLLLVPYAAWTGFATALNASIARKNS